MYKVKIYLWIILMLVFSRGICVEINELEH